MTTETDPLCDRYSFEGEKCTNPAPVEDRWCRQCDGFVRPERTKGGKPDRSEPRLPVGEAVPMPIPADRAHSVSIYHCVLQQFTRHHPGTRHAAAASQVRSLLEDMLVYGQAARTAKGGYCLHLKGFQLFLTADARAVSGYSTSHHERTYAQVKSGVKSRAPRPRTTQAQKDRYVAFCEERMVEVGMPVRVTAAVAKLYAKRVLGLSTTKSRHLPDEVLLPLKEHLVNHVMPYWPTERSEDGRWEVVDSAGWAWLVVDREVDRAVIAFFPPTVEQAQAA